MKSAKLRVAFDLDDTLILPNSEFTEEISQYKLLTKIFKAENLRLGTKEIFHFFEKENCERWIYTTSYRSVKYIKWLFLVHGIKLHGIVNQEIHNKNVSLTISKYPPAFNIDILIDDSKGVLMEGNQNNFQVIQIDPNDLNWVEKIKRDYLRIKTEIHFD
ncbi:MAG: HAD family hydrolase [Leptospiraceae bacterium]|nr:HAD family hydrolase [Leptospiraceae bacterium]